MHTENKQNSDLLAADLADLLSLFQESEIVLKYRQRLNEGRLTRDENPESHFCAYFAAFDQEKKTLFMGHHKKSGLWLFNGGHIDSDEATVRQTVVREIDEEWGLGAEIFTIKAPELLTITEINNPTKQKCRFHYDLWHFISVDSETFKPNPDKLHRLPDNSNG